MRVKWLTPVLIVLGAILLLFSSALDSAAVGVNTLWFKIAGLIMLMLGIYKAAQKSSKPEESDKDRR